MNSVTTSGHGMRLSLIRLNYSPASPLTPKNHSIRLLFSEGPLRNPCRGALLLVTETILREISSGSKSRHQRMHRL